MFVIFQKAVRISRVAAASGAGFTGLHAPAPRPILPVHRAAHDPALRGRDSGREHQRAREGTMSEASDAGRAGHWGQLCIGILCMTMIANLQHGWTLFVQPVEAAHH